MNREQMIREARTIEAMRKGYMGMEGKFSTVAKRLGSPIIEQGSSSFSQTFLEDPFELEKEDKIPLVFRYADYTNQKFVLKNTF